MKNWIFAAAAVVALTSCDDEKDFYNEMYIPIANPLEWQVDANQLQINVEIPGIVINTANQTAIDVYNSTEALGFEFSMAIEKQVDNQQWQIVASPQPTVTEGTFYNYAENGLYLAHLNRIAQMGANDYRFQSQFNLTPGAYRLTFAPIEINKTKVTFRSNSNNNALVFYLQSQLPNTSDGYYYFTID